MANDYWVDYSDPPYPAIRHRSHPLFDHKYNPLISLSAAKREIKEKCRVERQHWLSVMNRQISLTPEDIQQDAEETRKGYDA